MTNRKALPVFVFRKTHSMIEVVCYCVCLLFVTSPCQSRHLLDTEGYSNDSPYEIEPEQEYLKVKIGTPLTLKCPSNVTTWEYQPCSSNFQGLFCDAQSHWSKLNLTKGRKYIEAVDKRHNGKYKCSDENATRKIFVVDVVHPGYTGTKPYVAPLKTSNLTGQINMEFTIQCNVTSEVPPTIFWFKSCYGQKCDIEYNRICYCHIKTNTSVSSYNLGNTYLSKYSIFNARDVDSGVYACLAVTQYGANSQNVTIKVPYHEEKNESFSLLFLIPITLILLPMAIWLCYYRRKKKKSVAMIVEQQKQLIRPVVVANVEVNEII